jgi:small subunit ribosomal protein S18|uniref:Small ribosomal subunit protein bS18c n=2 Tax=unclassified Ostreobium TaxID=2086555 RepID=A0A1X9RPP2_9CHLO|nr:ribosomal protein S18 [Ostreobium sp. HV05007a]ARQ82273.1 ribosomal protein S18 [Ostreobium sp. HV05042]
MIIQQKLKNISSKNFRILENKSIKYFNFEKQKQILNYKNIFLLRKYISIEGKILPQRLTGLTSKNQRYLAKAIKNARIMGFLPFVRQVIY